MRTRLLRTHRSCCRGAVGIAPLLLLPALLGLGCSRSGLNSARTDGSEIELPTGAGGSLPVGGGGAGGNGQGGSGDRGRSSAGTAGSATALPMGTGGTLPSGRGGAGGSVQVPPGDGGWDPPGTTRVTASLAAVSFGVVDVGSTSTAQVVTIVVTGGTAALTPTVSGAGFAISGTTCANRQSPGACTVSVAFAPVAVGSATGLLSAGGVSVALSGIGVSGRLSFPDRIDLGTLQINQAAPVVIRVDTSSSTPPVTCMASGSSLTLASQTCPYSGALTASCTFTFTFKSSTPGAKSESVVCSSGGTVAQIIVTATVVTGASPTLNPPTATLSTPVGGSASASFTLANAGGSPTGDLIVTISDAGVSDFNIVSNECVVPLAPLAVCKIQVAFRPSTAGAKTGTLVVTDKASGQIATATLTGTSHIADPLVITPNPQDFGNVTVGTTKTVSFTAKNTGSYASDVIDIGGGSGQFIIDASTCKGISLAPASSCTFTVTFAPSGAPGVETAMIGLIEAGMARAWLLVAGTAVASIIDAGTDAGTLDSGPADAAQR